LTTASDTNSKTSTTAEPAVADGVSKPLDSRHVDLQRLIGWILSAWLAGASLIALLTVWLVRGLTWPALGGLALAWTAGNTLVAWHLHRWPAIRHRHASYMVDRQGIEIRRGVFWRKAINIPRSRVQHTDVSQGPLERRYGLGTLVIHTAGTDFAQVSLAGLAHDTAFRIRQHLQPDGQDDAV
jgi:membrane protein YdbS with pleckstrin-like domain